MSKANRRPLYYALAPIKPTFDNIIYVIGGHTQTQSWLEQGNGVGKIWLDLVNSGYNAYLSADGAALGGSFNQDGSGQGLGFNEITNEFLNATTTHGAAITKLGLIGYSHGGGIAYNLAANQLYSWRTGDAQQIAFAGTIDAVERDQWDIDINPLAYSPGAQDAGWNAVCSNWWEPNGVFLGFVRGQNMADIPAGSNHELPANELVAGKTISHTNIYNDLNVIVGIESDLGSTFGHQVIHK